MQTIQQIITGHNDEATIEEPGKLIATLLAREDEVADTLRFAAVQFGLYPQIVAKVFADVEFGSPISDEQKAMVQHQFAALMEALHEAFNNNTPPPQP